MSEQLKTHRAMLLIDNPKLLSVLPESGLLLANDPVDVVFADEAIAALAALAAKDARIAELEQKIIGLEDAFASNLDYRAMYRQLRAQLASQQQAEPLIDTSAWQSCNPGCDPEFNGEKGRHCVCDPAKAAMSAKKANSINPEMVDVVGYTTAGMLSISKDLPLTGRIGAKCKPDERWNVPLMTVAQHSRIVAAKDAEIARVTVERNRLIGNARSVFKDMAEMALKQSDELAKELAALRAQPARHVGDDCYVQAVPEHCDRITWRGHYYGLPPLAPAAPCVMPERKDELPEVYQNEKLPAYFHYQGYNAALDEVARLNRRAIPVGLLERICLQRNESVGWAASADAINELRALLGKEMPTDN